MKRKDFIDSAMLNKPEELEALIRKELETDLQDGYTARFYLFDRFNDLKMMGHEAPFERIGEILNEFEHAIEYTESNVGRFFYQDLIDNAIWYFERERRPQIGIFTYPGIISLDYDFKDTDLKTQE